MATNYVGLVGNAESWLFMNGYRLGAAGEDETGRIEPPR